MTVTESKRKMLTLAAQAAEYEVMWNESSELFQHSFPEPDRHGQLRYSWEPFDDDGDALRLAIKLDLNLSFNEDCRCVLAYRGNGLHIMRNYREEGKSAATRYAIVSAAALLGEDQADNQVAAK